MLVCLAIAVSLLPLRVAVFVYLEPPAAAAPPAEYALVSAQQERER